jgi:formylglycine-generating enzyme required for sulfatase activity
MWDGLDEKTGNRVIRGGSCYDAAGGCAVAARNGSNPEARASNYGFRVALSAVP